MHVNKTIPEVFETIKNMKGCVDDKAQVLKMYDSRAMRFVVDFMYNGDKTRLYIPEYTASSKPVGMNYMTIESALQQIMSALDHRDNVKVYERNVVRVLESVSSDEALLIEALLTGNKVDGIPKAVFKRVWPSFFRNAALGTLDELCEEI